MSLWPKRNAKDRLSKEDAKALEALRPISVRISPTKGRDHNAVTSSGPEEIRMKLSFDFSCAEDFVLAIIELTSDSPGLKPLRDTSVCFRLPDELAHLYEGHERSLGPEELRRIYGSRAIPANTIFHFIVERAFRCKAADADVKADTTASVHIAGSDAQTRDLTLRAPKVEHYDRMKTKTKRYFWKITAEGKLTADGSWKPAVTVAGSARQTIVDAFAWTPPPDI